MKRSHTDTERLRKLAELFSNVSVRINTGGISSLDLELASSDGRLGVLRAALDAELDDELEGYDVHPREAKR